MIGLIEFLGGQACIGNTASPGIVGQAEAIYEMVVGRRCGIIIDHQVDRAGQIAERRREHD